MEDSREQSNHNFSKWEPWFPRQEKMRSLGIEAFRLMTVPWQAWTVNGRNYSLHNQCQQLLKSLQLACNFLMYFNIQIVVNIMKLFVYFNRICCLTFWRRTFFQILAHLVFKMWVIQKPNKVALWNERHFEEKKCTLYSMFKIFSTDICWINTKWGM